MDNGATTTGTGYHLDVIGPFELRDPTGRIVPVRPMAKRLISALAFREGADCGRQWLIDVLWPDGAPDSAVKSLQNTVAQIRRACQHEIIETVTGGYRLASFVSIDRSRLRRLARGLRKWDDQRSVDDLAKAEEPERWAGQPWECLSDLPDVQADVEAIETERRDISARRAEIVAVDNPEAGAALAAELISANPWDERLRRLHVTSLYRAGRRAESLRELAQARVTLAEAGLDLGPELIELERQVLNDEVDGAPHSVSYNAPDRGPIEHSQRLNIGHFVGRSDELSILQDLQQESQTGGFSSCLIVGPPGIGKTWLAAKAVAAEPATPSLFAPCVEHASGPFQPVIDALESLADHSQARRFLSQLDHGEPGSLPSRLTADRSRGQPDNSVKLRDLLTTMAPVTLIVDDVQWADDATASALCQLVATGRPAGVLLVVLSRPGRPSHDSVSRLQELISRTGSVLNLDGLNRSELGSMLHHHSALLSEDDASLLISATGGNPLIASLLLRGSAIDHSGLRPDPHAFSLSTELDTLVSSQLAMAGDRTAETLRWMAVCERPQNLALLAEASKVDHLASITAAEHAVELGLAVETGPDRFELAHTTLRAGILQDLSASRIALMHAGLRDALLALGASDRWPEVAFHAIRASGSDAHALAAHATLKAARGALDRFSPRDALRLIEEMIERLPDAAVEPALHIDLLNHAALAAGLAFDNDKRDALSALALDLARQHRYLDQFAQAALVRGVNWQQGEFDEETQAITREALELLGSAGSPAIRAQLLANLSGLYAVSSLASDVDPVAQALSLADQAMAAARESDDAEAHFAAYQARIVGLWATPGYDEQIEVANKIMALDGSVAYWQASLGLRWRAIPRFCVGNRGGFRADTNQLHRIADDYPGRGSLFTAYASQWLAMDALIDGDWSRTIELVTTTLEQFPDDHNIASGALSQLAWIALETGKANGYLPAIEQAATDQPHLPALAVFAAYAWALVGDHERAAARMAEVVVDGVDSLPRDITWTSMMAAIAETCVITENAKLATEMLDVLVPWHGTLICVSGGLWCLGAAERSTALFHHAAGDDKRAATLLAMARELEDPLGADAVSRRRSAWEARLGLANTRDVRDRAISSGHLGLLPLLD